MPGKVAPAPRGPYKTGIQRREQIVQAALTVFGERGFAGGSIRTIAERVGVSHATLLQHFGSKEALLMAVLEEWDRRTVETGLSGVEGLEYFRRLPLVMSGHLANPGLLGLFITMAAEASNPAHPAHAFIRHRYDRNLTTLAGHLRQAADTGEAASLTPARIDTEVRIVTAVLDGIGLQWLNDPSTDIVQAVATFIDRTIADWRRH
ncbi:transcriptional regulator, TetR family [Pseudarthrobacter chlorophenolicus A6]|uniref:Transcriptional regulator, TetR family n=1 Tax=Pseudarthrobacter chlorophenolicus (strain ATCC 700700 / DSM 12829 / CIP 107037 / JCM 12360 / KCTC 9906 / NCIMB 13794 / A6) TaxID=452863 RepID=B8H7F6_PSECP|nr:TetR/AcrR family transcriptional regulator [Pseudarthrobacter chlorophenolicus]ACL39736.1 transcriptional regulator, TetR family [Pseudarthrobacter chlorophenolicus A6]SDQ94582.1 DNA-binding transcriptional regulator, AcrR family [Pseudarthrobacter chlorophenolicus]